jgi:hypothetical protein
MRPRLRAACIVARPARLGVAKQELATYQTTAQRVNAIFKRSTSEALSTASWADKKMRCMTARPSRRRRRAVTIAYRRVLEPDRYLRHSPRARKVTKSVIKDKGSHVIFSAFQALPRGGREG